MSTERATPEELLRRIHAEEEAKEKEKKGKLCIFLGYAAGVGKPAPCWMQLMSY